MNRVQFPYDYIPDKSVGRPLFDADLYFGIVDLDPEIPANQIDVYGKQEDGSSVLLPQPINTGAGGVPLYNGSPVELLAAELNYSFKALSRTGAQIYYAENVASVLTAEAIEDFIPVIENVAALASTPVVPGKVYYLKEYNSGTGVGGGELTGEPGSTTYDYGITFPGIGGYFRRINYQYITTDMFGGKNDGTQNGDLLTNILANHDIVYVPAGIFKSYKINLAANKGIIGVSESETRIIVTPTTGDNYGIKISNLAIGVTTSGSSPVDRTTLKGFTLDFDGAVDYGLYVAHARFFNHDEIAVESTTICNIFYAYCFVGTIGRVTAIGGENTGIEYGYDRFSWGDAYVSNNAVTVKMFWAFGNGAALAAPPATPYSGAGIIWGTSLACPSFLYAEGNNGYGVVTVGSPCAIDAVYVEANDTFSIGAAKREIYAGSTGGTAVFGEVTVLGGAPGSMYCPQNVVINSYGGTRITGPGRVKVNAFYRDCTIDTPSTVAFSLVTQTGLGSVVVGSTKSFTLNKNNVISISKFTHNGIYKIYPRVTFEDAGTISDGVQCTIINRSTGFAKYYEAWVYIGAITAGQAHDFGATDITDYNEAQDYQIFFEGATSYTGRMTISLQADLMV